MRDSCNSISRPYRYIPSSKETRIEVIPKSWWLNENYIRLYPFDYAKSKEEAEFTISTNSCLIKNSLPIATYHLNYVICNCPHRTDKKNPILRQIQSLFRNKIQDLENLLKRPREKRRISYSKIPQEKCRIHYSKDFDVYVASNKTLFTWV